MSEWRVEVVRIGPVRKHPNADSLSLADVHGGYPCIFRTGDFAEGDLAVYVPVDSLVPVERPEFAFLAGRHEKPVAAHRVRAVRLRGEFSMGLLIPARAAWGEGQLVHEELGVTKYEPPEDLTTSGENERDPGLMPVYTDVEGWRRWSCEPGVVVEGETVTVTEKVHGACARYVFHDGRLWVGSRTCIKREDERSIWWRAAKHHDLAARLIQEPDLIVYGEVYGQVQDLKYGVPSGVRFAAFDAMRWPERKYVERAAFDAFMGELGLPTMPVFYRGPWTDLHPLAEGPSVLGAGSCVREGAVVKPDVERWHPKLGRVILKLHGEGYLTRKEKRA